MRQGYQRAASRWNACPPPAGAYGTIIRDLMISLMPFISEQTAADRTSPWHGAT
jgi:hypothetical protein